MSMNEEFILNIETKDKILKICSTIQEVLHSIEEDFGSQYFILNELTQRALTRINWYKDQLNTFSDFNKDTCHHDLKKDIFKHVVEFPTWELISLLGAIVNEPNPNCKLCTCAYKILTIVQNILTCWQQFNHFHHALEACLENHSCYSTEIYTFKTTLLTKGQFSVLLKLLLPLYQNISKKDTTTTSFICSFENVSLDQPWTILLRQLSCRTTLCFKGTIFALCMTKEEIQQMQLKVIQILTLLCSIQTPVLNSMYSISSTKLDPFFILLVEKCYSCACEPILKVPSGFEIFLTLVFFQFSFPVVKNTSKAALFQLFKCLTYQCFPFFLDESTKFSFLPTLFVQQNRICFGFLFVQLSQMISFLFHHTLSIETHTCLEHSFCSSSLDALGICFDLLVFLLDFLKSIQPYDQFLLSLIRKEIDFFLLNFVQSPIKEPYLLSLCLKVLLSYSQLINSLDSSCSQQLSFLSIAQSHKEKTIGSSIFTFYVNEKTLQSFLYFLWTKLICNYTKSNYQEQLIQILLFSRFLLLTPSFQSSWKQKFLACVIPFFTQLFHTCFSNDTSIHSVPTSFSNNSKNTILFPYWWKHGILTSTLLYPSNKTNSIQYLNDMRQQKVIQKDTSSDKTILVYNSMKSFSNHQGTENVSFSNKEHTPQQTDPCLQPLNTILDNSLPQDQIDTLNCNDQWNLHREAFHELIQEEKQFYFVYKKKNSAQMETIKQILSKSKFFSNDDTGPKKNSQSLQSIKKKNCLLFVLKLHIEMLAAGLVDCIDSMYQNMDNSCFDCAPSFLDTSKELSHLSVCISISQTNHIIYSPLIQPLTQNQSELQDYVKRLWMPYLSSLSVILSLDLSLLSLTMFCFIMEIFKALIALLCIFTLPCGLHAIFSFLSRYLCMSFDTLANDLTQLSFKKNMDCHHYLKLYLTQLNKNISDSTIPSVTETSFVPASWSHSFQCTLHSFDCFLHLVESFASCFQTSHWLFILKVFETFNDLFPQDFLFLDFNVKPTVMSKDVACFQKSFQFFLDSNSSQLNLTNHHKTSPFFFSFQDLKWISSRLFNFFNNTNTFFQSSYGLRKVSKALGSYIVDSFGILEQNNINTSGNLTQHLSIHQQSLVQGIMSFITNDSFFNVDFGSMDMTCIMAIRIQFIKKNHLDSHSTQQTISCQDNFYLSCFYIFILNNTSFFQHPQNGYIVCHLLVKLFQSSAFKTQKNMLNAIDFLRTYGSHVINKIALPPSLANSSTLPSAICFHTSMLSVILSTFLKVFVNTTNDSLKYAILKNMYTLITSNGSRIESSVSWTLITLFSTVCMQESYHLNEDIWLFHLNMLTSNITTCSNTETYCIQNAFSFKPIEWSISQHNDLFTFLEYLILQCRMKIYEPVALVLISLSISTMASCHESGHNISFTSVGLLWTLAECLIRRYTILKENTKIETFSLPILPNHAYRELNFSFTKKHFQIPLGMHSSLEEQQQLSRTVMIIFHLFRYHALDSRIEVRNCTLKSLLLAYEEILQKTSNHHNIFKQYVSQTILHVLKDCVSTYKLLMEHKPSFEKNFVVNDGSLHHHSRDSQIKLWDETFSILFDAVTRLIQYYITCVSCETSLTESHYLLKFACDTAIEFPKHILLNCAENSLTSPQVIASCLSFVVIMITKSIECGSLSFSFLESYWILFEQFSTALWSFSVLPNQIVDYLIVAVTKLCSNVLPIFFHKNVERCARLFSACVSSVHYAIHVAQIPEFNFFKNYPYRSGKNAETVFPPLKLCEKIILSGAHFFQKNDTYFFKHILNGNGSDQLLDFLRTTFSYVDNEKTDQFFDKCFQNSRFINQNILENLIFDVNDLNSPARLEFSTGTNHSYSSIPAYFCSPIRKSETWESPFEKFIPQNDIHGNDESLKGTDDKKNLALEFVSTCTRLKLKQQCLDDEYHNYALEYEKLCENDSEDPFDDDYVTLPSWILPEFCISLKNHPQLYKEFSQIIKIKRRLRVARKKILSIDSYFELFEGHFPWEQLLVLSPYLWLTILKKSFSYFFSCDRLIGNPNFLVKTLRFINSVTRIQRRCYFYVSTLRTESDDVFFGLVILTYKLCTKLISLIIFLRNCHALSHQTYLFEAVIQNFMDLKMFLDYVFQGTHTFPSNLLNLLELLSIPLVALLDTWSSFQKIMSSSSSSSENFLNNNIGDLFPFLAQILLIHQTRLSYTIRPSKLKNLLVFSLVCFLETISLSKYSPYCQNMPILGLAVLFDIAKEYGKVGMLPVNVLSKENAMNERVDNYTVLEWQYYIIIVCLVNRMRTLFNDYVKEENDSGQCPMPRYRLEQVWMALIKIKELDSFLHTINIFNLKDNKKALALVNFFFVKSWGSCVPQAFKQTFVFELFPDLIQLISSKDKTVRYHVTKLLECLVPYF